MAVCKACGTENRNKAKFCRGCAAPLPPEPASARGGVLPEHVCPTCKARNSAKALFCQACGVPLVPPSVAFLPMPELPGSGTRQRAGLLLVGGALVLAGLGARGEVAPPRRPAPPGRHARGHSARRSRERTGAASPGAHPRAGRAGPRHSLNRSEERRVGKEC